jgi:hypothetical protein
MLTLGVSEHLLARPRLFALVTCVLAVDAGNTGTRGRGGGGGWEGVGGDARKRAGERERWHVLLSNRYADSIRWRMLWRMLAYARVCERLHVELSNRKRLVRSHLHARSRMLRCSYACADGC